jgi:hypothetical protein
MKRDYDGSENVARPPKVGDIGTVVHVIPAKDSATKYIVESVDSNGYTIWLADFVEEELVHYKNGT